MRGRGGTATEPVVIEMSDQAATLISRAIRSSLTVDDWTASERRALQQIQAALAETSQ